MAKKTVGKKNSNLGVKTDDLKKDYVEVRFHGRGGQGAKTAAQLLAEAALLEGKEIQAFPEYGPERGGAPMKAFVRISNKPILTSQPVVSPDFLLVIDPTLFSLSGLFDGTDKDTVMIVNSKTKPEFPNFKGKLFYVDATGIALSELKENRTNTVILGALVKVSGVVGLKSLVKVTENHFLGKIGSEKTKANIKMITRAFDEVSE